MRFAENLKKLRIERGLSQRELADLIYVARSSVGKWESGSRLPYALMIFRLSRCLGVDTGTLLSIEEENDGLPTVILVDDSEIILTGEKLLEINPRTNIVFLTAYADYSFDAWQTGASGFMRKPLSPEGVREQLQILRYPFPIEGLDT